MLAIALALGASFCWGSGDFLGGLTTRRASLWAVIIGSQAAGLAGAALVTLVTGHPWPGLAAVWPVLLGGARQRRRDLLLLQGAGHRHDEHRGADQRHQRADPVPRRAGAGRAAERRAARRRGRSPPPACVLAASERARAGETIGAAALPNEPAVEPGRRRASGRRGRSPRRNQRRADRAGPLVAAVAWASCSSATTPRRSTTRSGRCSAGACPRPSLFAVLFLVAAAARSRCAAPRCRSSSPSACSTPAPTAFRPGHDAGLPQPRRRARLRLPGRDRRCWPTACCTSASPAPAGRAPPATLAGIALIAAG